MSLNFPSRTKSLVELVQAQRELAHEQHIAEISAKELPVSNGAPPGKQPPRGETFTCKACGKTQPQCRTGHPKVYCDIDCRKASERAERKRVHEQERADRDAAILRLHGMGQYAVDIARTLNVSEESVRYVLRTVGMRPNGVRR
jgi:DNA-binding NarL/FixJ family response regulator